MKPEDKNVSLDTKDLNIEDIQGSRHLRLARAYVPFQSFIRQFEPFEALHRGTIFPELCRPYRERKT